MNYKAKITYLFHSCFAVETANHLLIFDYYQPKVSTKPDGKITGETLKTKKNVYVFSSHSHADHFDPVIFKWAKDNPSITYLLSSDITHLAGDNYHFLAPYQAYTTAELTVKAFGSTDIGVSFLTQTDGLTIFHAGDLNWWHWKGDTKPNQQAAEKLFKTEIAKLAGANIDIAFFPVDRRLEEFYAQGAQYFAAKLQPRLLLPMHFGRDFAATAAFAKILNGPVKTAEITHKGQEFYF
ncbi:MAG: MBL fold metallo-hydrolase [Pelosinus sp.]|nr:MBL fold metallo-hydrolase [Pelosinus sp.]